MSYESVLASLQYSPRKPSNKDYQVQDEDGWSIAHHWATTHILPPEFEHWALADKDGWTVAHAAAQARHLPKAFNQWLLKDNNGDTVAHIAVRVRHYDMKTFSSDVMAAVNNKGVSVWDEVRADSAKKIAALRNIIAS